MITATASSVIIDLYYMPLKFLLEIMLEANKGKSKIT